MAAPRIRDFITFLTTIPAAMLIAACLFLPHTKSCSSSRTQTPWEASTWFVIVPLVVFGLLPVLWRVLPQRRRLAEPVLAFTMIVLALLVITIPIAIYLMWGYAKRTFRGELLVALCSATCVMLWLFFYPFITIFNTWLPAAEATWLAALVECIGLMFWVSAAAERPANALEPWSLHEERDPLGFQLHM